MCLLSNLSRLQPNGKLVNALGTKSLCKCLTRVNLKERVCTSFTRSILFYLHFVLCLNKLNLFIHTLLVYVKGPSLTQKKSNSQRIDRGHVLLLPLSFHFSACLSVSYIHFLIISFFQDIKFALKTFKFIDTLTFMSILASSYCLAHVIVFSFKTIRVSNSN